MRTELQLAANPFALMMQPEAVLRTVENSDALRQLRLRKFHLLDDPQPRMATMAPVALFKCEDATAARLAARSQFDAKGFPTLVN